MSETPENKILIKFEIHVPVGAAGAPVVINPAPAAVPLSGASTTVPNAAAPTVLPSQSQPGDRKTKSYAVVQPGDIARVKVSGTGSATGAICVTAANDTAPYGIRPDRVVCLVLSNASDPIPHTPTGATGERDAVPAAPSTDLTNWIVAELPDARCSAGTGTNLPFNEVVIWRKFDGEDIWTVEVRGFRGTCATNTECEDGGSSPVTADAAARVWELVAKGFSGVFSPVNGIWHLIGCRRSPQGSMAWSSGGDGVSKPRIVLTSFGCGGKPMELAVSCAGHRLVYDVPHGRFNPLGSNRLQLSGNSRPPQGAIVPTELVVTPATGLK